MTLVPRPDWYGAFDSEGPPSLSRPTTNNYRERTVHTLGLGRRHRILLVRDASSSLVLRVSERDRRHDRPFVGTAEPELGTSDGVVLCLSSCPRSGTVVHREAHACICEKGPILIPGVREPSLHLHAKCQFLCPTVTSCYLFFHPYTCL